MMPLNEGLVGAGIGGLAAAIALKEHGGDAIRVTVLEAAAELGEIGAGIQMTPNVARLIVKWGIDKIIGDNLVEFDTLNLRTKDGKIVGHSKMDSGSILGIPWWLVHRMHLHNGLIQGARKRGAELITGARVFSITHTDDRTVRVTTEARKQWHFDILIGSDGLNSIVRNTILPNTKPRPPTRNCAYRAIVPVEQINADPVARELLRGSEMNVWMGAGEGKQHGYVITYLISGGRDYNMVLSHHRPYLVDKVEDADMNELRDTFKDYDPRLRRIIDMIPDGTERWPLMVTRSKTWSNPQKNIVLMGDAAHSMVNHMAQGAATSMEDGAFLGVVLGYVARHPNELSVAQAIELYEQERMPHADLKQQLSYANGAIWHFHDDSPEAKARDEALKFELSGGKLYRTPNLNADPWVWRTFYEYDVQKRAEDSIKSLVRQSDLRDRLSSLTREQADMYMNWFLPPKSRL